MAKIDRGLIQIMDAVGFFTLPFIAFFVIKASFSFGLSKQLFYVLFVAAPIVLGAFAKAAKSSLAVKEIGQTGEAVAFIFNGKAQSKMAAFVFITVLQSFLASILLVACGLVLFGLVDRWL